jgi:dihydrofolate reductase
MWEAIDTIVMGRNLFDLVNGWEGQPPAGDHVVVVSHGPKPEGWHPEVSYHFVDGVTAAIDKAQELAGERTLSVNAGELGSQILAAGLVDEVAMDVVPDHLIPLELGGASTVANLWLEPWADHRGAHRKDDLENALNRQVCSGSMTLSAPSTRSPRIGRRRTGDMSAPLS